MSYRLVDKVIAEVDLPWLEKYLLIAMARHADDDGSHCRPSNALLASETGLGERTVRSLKRKLEQPGILGLVRGGSGGRGMATEYRICLDKAPRRNTRHDTPPFDTEYPAGHSPFSRETRQDVPPNGGQTRQDIPPKGAETRPHAPPFVAHNPAQPAPFSEKTRQVAAENPAQHAPHSINDSVMIGSNPLRGTLRVSEGFAPDEDVGDLGLMWEDVVDSARPLASRRRKRKRSVPENPAEWPITPDEWMELLLAPKANEPEVLVAMITKHSPRQAERWKAEGVSPFSAVGRLVARDKSSPFENWPQALKAVWQGMMDQPKGDLIDWVVGKVKRQRRDRGRDAGTGSWNIVQ